MKMKNLLTTIAFTAVTLVASAQGKEPVVRETPEITAKATERVDVLDSQVKLTEEQRAQAFNVYLQVEQYYDAMVQRYADQPKEDFEADIKSQYVNMDRTVDERLSTILRPEQYSKWKGETK